MISRTRNTKWHQAKHIYALSAVTLSRCSAANLRVASSNCHPWIGCCQRVKRRVSHAPLSELPAPCGRGRRRVTFAVIADRRCLRVHCAVLLLATHIYQGRGGGEDAKVYRSTCAFQHIVIPCWHHLSVSIRENLTSKIGIEFHKYKN